MSLEPGVAERLEARHKGGVYLAARKVEFGDDIDPVELCYERGWSDGLPVTPPTDARVVRMLKGTTRKADEVIGRIPPYLAPCTIEKVAINAVMAGCKPEYMPVLLAALEAALEPVFTLHGVLAITALIATFSMVQGARYGGIRPMTSSALRVVPFNMRTTRTSVGGVTGRPSLQPRS